MQTSPMLVRLGGAAAALGGVLWSAKGFHDRNDAPPWPTDVTDTLLFVVPLLFLIGLAGLHARCRGRLGVYEGESVVWFGMAVLGLATSVAGLLSMALEAGASWLFGVAWFGFCAANLSLLLFGITVLRTGALGHLNGLPLAIGALCLLAVAFSDSANSGLGDYASLAVWMLYGLAWAALGCVLVAQRGGSVAARPAQAR